ncbi:glycoside hydrolase [Rathayibacter tanaceti]|uniref:Ricin-type beta-trefoil lectin protein n=3 Tax=Rathayibacter tanaceti TaxID=1671680 RepID=A0ACD2XGA2_9MICO|nr:glycoside hydrolase [Rathayibacter tanaceti]KZX21818.1 Bacterial Ig-like domain (group 4) [Rathayibacter tanaceti]TCO32981.1 ricin-type beta-trefoil lectin protein [Rathayibacter tanaceti]
MSMSFRRVAALATSAALATGALLAIPAAAAPAQAADTFRITPNPAFAGEAFEGWGTSLVWFANATGNYPEALREDLYQKVFGEDGLDLNIARYNIGGGNASDVQDYLRPGGAVEGWWKPDTTGAAYGGTTTNYADRAALLAKWNADDPASYDWTADETQRWWVEKLAAEQQISHWEAFANSAPYFMTESGYVSGGFTATSEQLKPAAEQQFAKYLVNVTEHVEDEYGIEFDTLDPFNEPNTNYWGTQLTNGVPTGGRQEGMHMGPARQADLIPDVAAALEASTTDAGLAAMDETNPSIFTTNWAAYSPAIRAEVDRMNVHTYGTSDRLAVRDLSKQADTDLWMSEIEGNWVQGYDPANIENGLGIAGRIHDDLRELEPKAWVLWQPVEDLYNMSPKGENLNWGSIFIDLDCQPYQEAGGELWKSARRVADAGGDSTKAPVCGVETNSKFNTIRNFTTFISEGDRLMSVNDTASTAAIRADGTGATIVHSNTATASQTITLDLSRFGTIADGATVTPSVTTQASSAAAPTGNALVQKTAVVIDRESRTATVTVPAKSVTTFAIDGVSGVADSAPALRDGYHYQLVGTQSGKALTATTTGAATTITTLATDSAAAAKQNWTVHEVPAGEREATRRVVLQTTDGRVLGATTAGTDLRSVSVDSAKATAATRWIVNSTDGVNVTLVNESIAQSLDVNGQSSAENTAVGVYGSNGGANQSWTLRDLAPAATQTVAVRTTVGVAPTLPASITPQYSWGAGSPVAVTWQRPADAAYGTAGRVEVKGTATDLFGQSIPVTALVDVGGLTATDPVSVTVASGASVAGVKAAAPTTVPARVGASTSTFAVPVTWDWTPLTTASLAQPGSVPITGTATADGATLPATLTVLVTAGTLRNVNPDAGIVASATSAESGYGPERTRNGVDGDKGWSNWVSGTKAAQSTLTYTFPGARQVQRASVQFFRDGTNSWAQSAQLQYRAADGTWTSVPGWETAQPVASPADGTAPTLVASFAPVTATAFRIVMNANANTHMIVSEVKLFESVASPAAVSALGALRVNGVGVAAFDPARTSYAVTVKGTTMPVITAAATDSAARVRVTQPTTANGGVASVAVTSADGTSTTTTTVTVTLKQPAALAVAVTATTRCITGTVTLTVTALNNAGVPVSMTVASAYGSKEFTGVAPGKNASAAFSTRAASVPAGEATVTATGTAGGTTVTTVIPAAYAARRCS